MAVYALPNPIPLAPAPIFRNCAPLLPLPLQRETRDKWQVISKKIPVKMPKCLCLNCQLPTIICQLTLSPPASSASSLFFHYRAPLPGKYRLLRLFHLCPRRIHTHLRNWVIRIILFQALFLPRCYIFLSQFYPPCRIRYVSPDLCILQGWDNCIPSLMQSFLPARV